MLLHMEWNEVRPSICGLFLFIDVLYLLDTCGPFSTELWPCNTAVNTFVLEEAVMNDRVIIKFNP